MGVAGKESQGQLDALQQATMAVKVLQFESELAVIFKCLFRPLGMSQGYSYDTEEKTDDTSGCGDGNTFIRTMPGAEHQLRHTDRPPESTLATMRKFGRVSVLVLYALSPGGRTVWIQGGLGDKESKMVPVHLQQGEALFFRADLRHAGFANESREIHYGGHVYMDPMVDLREQGQATPLHAAASSFFLETKEDRLEPPVVLRSN